MDTLFEKYGLFDAVGIWSSVKADAKAESHFFFKYKNPMQTPFGCASLKMLRHSTPKFCM